MFLRVAINIKTAGITFFQGTLMYNLMWLSLLLNIAIMFMDKYWIGKENIDLFMKIDWIITGFYLLEVIVRIVYIGHRNFFRDMILTLDFLIVTATFFEMILIILGVQITAGNIKFLKVLRVFQFFYFSNLFKALAILYKETILTLYKTLVFLITVSVFILVIAMIGRELFAYTVRFNHITNALDL